MIEASLSVIVPVYNAEQYLERCVAALLSQTHPIIEIIFIDDGSSDLGGILCDNLTELSSFITVVHHQNGGVSSARNIGLKLANGTYIGFVDCDDKPKSLMYSELVEAIQGADIAFGAYVKTNNDRSEIIHLPYNCLLNEESVEEIAYSMAFWGGYYHEKQLPMIYGSVWPNLYRKSIIINNAVSFPENIKLGEDLLFNLQYLSFCKKVYMHDQPLYEYSVDTQSATRKINQFLWQDYVLLLELERKILVERYCINEELFYNINKQYISFAISVVEEQILPYARKKDYFQQLKQLCDDVKLNTACRYIMEHSKYWKDYMQAFLFRFKLMHLLTFWLSR